MDPLVVDDAIAVLVDLYNLNALPKAAFSLTEMEGLIARHLGKDVSGKQLTAAFGALEVGRTSHRVWDHHCLLRVLAQVVSEDGAHSIQKGRVAQTSPASVVSR